MPRSHGDGQIHSSRFAASVYTEDKISEAPELTVSPEELAIGKFAASIIDNGATLQMGIGGIPNAVLKCLTDHKNLGVHTEMFSDGLIDLVEKDIVTNKYKRIHPNKVVTGFALGTKMLYDYVHDNPAFAVLIPILSKPSLS